MPISPHQMQCGSYTLSLDKTHVMGIINVTPDSFYQESRTRYFESAIKQAECMLLAGASVIDVGGESTRPGALGTPSTEEELDRVIPVVDYVANHLNALVSVDTSNPIVMTHAIEAGAALINDVRALTRPGAMEVLKAHPTTAIILMHSLCDRHETKELPMIPHDMIATIKSYLQDRVMACKEAGISSSRLILDPGFGGGFFGKTPTQNLQLLNRIKALKILGLPLLAGVSRKSFMCNVLDRDVNNRLWMSLASAAWLAMEGINIIRVHDVEQTVDVVKMIQAIQTA